MTAGEERVEQVAGVDLWCLWLDSRGAAAVGEWEGLTAQERQRARALARPELRRQFADSRRALRAVLARYATPSPDPVEFRLGPAGKPSLDRGPYFNLSHAEDRLLVAVDPRREVGVDLERIRRVDEAQDIARRCFDASEEEALRSAGPDPDSEAFLRCWTRREAWLKACGLGLGSDRAREPLDAARWEVHELRPWPGFLGALVVERRPPITGQGVRHDGPDGRTGHEAP